ncbi:MULTISPECIES: S1C family serine protease [Myxococcus]|uniref:S1C family serine protease n=1 Tax=Myxococcus TaxID=32 RepID=UPI001CBD5C9A|nr:MULTISPECIES: serine protease [Myxococcus]MBZ4397119.1 serine protease [Myxococcus sp. AS-1-15]MBZ4408156.1 serine protease [Myxococcus sp. XM-1-1-1]MCK8503397.1 serine protease [Myxococcus fulvus]
MVSILVLLVCTSMSTPPTEEAATPPPTETTPAGAPSTSLPQTIKLVAPGVVTIKTYDSQGAPLGLGSGFLVEGGRVVTNAHVVENAARAEVYDSEEQLLGVTDYAESLSAHVDLAVLPAMPSPPKTLHLATSEPLVGENIFVIGAPQGLSNTVSTGIVSALRGNEGKRWIQITAPISQGSSGGPVLNHSGEVVGVSVAVLRDGQNLNFAVPIRDVKALIGSPPGRITFTVPRPQSQPQDTALASSEPEPPPKPDFNRALLAYPRISPNQPLYGEINDDDPPLPSGGRTDIFSAEGKKGDVYTVVAVSESFSPSIAVVIANSNGVPESIGTMDGSGAHLSRLVIRLRSSGLFGLLISTVTSDVTGSYKIGLFKGELGLLDASKRISSNRWLLLTKESKYSIYLDKTSFRKVTQTHRKAWVWWEYRGWESHNLGRYNNYKSQQEYDCTERATHHLSDAYYEDGKLVDSDGASSRWLPWTPGSIGELIGETACGL